MSLGSSRPCQRRGAAVIELAVILPLLFFFFVIGVDFARVFYYSQAVTNCARTGAMWGSNKPANSVDTATIEKMALIEAKNLTPAPTVTSTTGKDSNGDAYVEVTVSWTFSTLTPYPGVPSDMVLTRTVRMRVTAQTPIENYAS